MRKRIPTKPLLPVSILTNHFRLHRQSQEHFRLTHFRLSHNDFRLISTTPKFARKILGKNTGKRG